MVYAQLSGILLSVGGPQAVATLSHNPLYQGQQHFECNSCSKAEEEN